MANTLLVVDKIAGRENASNHAIMPSFKEASHPSTVYIGPSNIAKLMKSHAVINDM